MPLKWGILRELKMIENSISKNTQYLDFETAIKNAPISIQNILVDAIQKNEIKTLIKVVSTPLFQKKEKRKKNITVFKSSRDTIDIFANFFNRILKEPKHSFDLTIDNYYLRFIETGNLKMNKIFSNKTAMQEVGVLVYLDNDLHDLNNYNPSNKLKNLDKQLIDDTLKFLKLDSSWDSSCKKSALTIINTFNNYKDYELHRNTNEFKLIKKLGSKLSSLNENKWNPSDIFLIKDSKSLLEDLKKINNIIDLNKFLFNNENIIGISLKKGEFDSVHGAIALNEVSRLNLLDWKANTQKTLNDALEQIYDDLESIKESEIADLVFITDFQEKQLIDLKEILKNKKLCQNFIKSLPPCISFLERICHDKYDFKEIIKSAYLTAVSQHQFSSSYYKVEGENISFIKNDNTKKIKFDVEKVLIPLNGETNVIFAINVNDHILKFQARSKNTAPQLTLIKIDPTKNIKAINISKFK